MTTGITCEADLREFYGQESELVRRKVLTRLDRHCRALIAASPFLVIGTSDAEGRQDVSPRGDPPGFVRVIDDQRLLIPDRPGNKRLDTLRNVLSNPQVGLLFFLPGMDETLRVNGRAEITTDPALLAPAAVDGRAPRSGLLVSVEEAFLHCAKAFLRSRLWDPGAQIDRKAFPSLGRMIADQVAEVDADAADAAIDESYRTRLY